MTFALELAARTIWQEARGEMEDGQRAIAHVIVNRLRDGRWGKSLASVCMWDRQFSGWNNSDPNRIASCTLPDDNPALARFREFITEAMTGADPDPTNNSTHYFNPKIVNPPWAEGKPYKQIGNHRFLRDVK
jgi:spore germination cell wall hydrolase CwlJ-like protein